MTKQEQAENILNQMSLLAGATSFIPVPILESGALTFIGYKMIKDLCEVYEIPFEENKSSTTLRSFAVSVLAVVAGEGLETVLEGNAALKVVSSLLSSSIINSFVYLTLGSIYRDHFENGGTLESLNLNNFMEVAANQLTAETIKTNFNKSNNKDYASLLSLYKS